MGLETIDQQDQAEFLDYAIKHLDHARKTYQPLIIREFWGHGSGKSHVLKELIKHYMTNTTGQIIYLDGHNGINKSLADLLKDIKSELNLDDSNIHKTSLNYEEVKYFMPKIGIMMGLKYNTNIVEICTDIERNPKQCSLIIQEHSPNIDDCLLEYILKNKIQMVILSSWPTDGIAIPSAIPKNGKKTNRILPPKKLKFVKRLDSLHGIQFKFK